MDYLGFCVHQGIKIYEWLRPDTMRTRIQSVINATKLQNKQEQTPDFRKETKTEKGWSLLYVLPPGIVQKDFEDRRQYFESYVNGNVDFEQSGRRLIMNIYQAKFPAKVPYQFDSGEYSEMLAPLPLGVAMDSTPLVVDLSTLPHMLVGGMTGYGKTTALIGFTVALLMSGVEVSIIDRKRLDFPQFSKWVDVAMTEKETENLLKKSCEQMDERIDELQLAGVQKFQQYKGDMKYKVIIIDELTAIESKKSQEYIDSLVHLGRAAGISLILATQKPSHKVWDGFTEARAMLGGRLCYYVADSTESQVVLGRGNTRGAELPMKPGRAIFNNDRDQMIQGYYIDAEKAIAILDKLPRRENKNEQQVIRKATR
ncbi:hypothetical protein LPY66_18085 [Dehalobacter sp. DCM]|uniref:FtsK/SpoIIIE domain-containing protein n=1 Tax=Dehalobacter sp. DCM TaxID=2907827 RepID=UPI003081F7A7|nr:hypothetical protein LPY66_18085 [Dehalobacter sp. DCM]